jgi:hypothetical protein
MKKLIALVLTMCVHTNAHAVDDSDYGYGYRYHGYNSLEQQQEAEHAIANMQRIQVLNELQQARQQMKNDQIDAERFLDAQRQYEMTLGD